MATNEASDRGSTPSKSPSISGTTPKQGSSKFINKFFRNKLSPTKENTPEDTSHKEVAKSPTGLTTPCPFIRPLEHKLEARNEPQVKPRHRTRSIETLSTTGSAFAVAVNRQETHRILNNPFSNENGDEMMANIPTMESVTEISGYQGEAEGDVQLQISRQIEYVAATAAADSPGVHHWSYYVQCYSKVRLLLSKLQRTTDRQAIWRIMLPPWSL